MEEKGVYLAIQTPRQVRKKPMYKKWNVPGKPIK